ncbi:hypothetical protein TcasGA2_TC002452 [Tribolium castaneum]|uniref:Uncharacterized protein n=1 Tax=Tribolium castaneum TaxID=7070 RepID=D6WI44_TRICA|nr:hypothetical protein TcasGA2_TC002452 [Tribolium castaneum]
MHGTENFLENSFVANALSERKLSESDKKREIRRAERKEQILGCDTCYCYCIYADYTIGLCTQRGPLARNAVLWRQRTKPTLFRIRRELFEMEIDTEMICERA